MKAGRKIVDALHSHAVAIGVNFVTSSRVVRVDHDGAVRGVELGELKMSQRRDTQSVACRVERRGNGLG